MQLPFVTGMEGGTGEETKGGVGQHDFSHSLQMLGPN
jgi:hypothetical protein|eukprot:CAMPEP_0174288450 /NCGR_PEP_ID=MMETSP0809-20121228/20650_1 /TAXON_ID=73025 ORGANISM="Eutreptiella gymnastica-like, Strain CCMP1594" /NCGR_SAMPLE_ID=MMETSP0809 /ASSEMBLY_ACC=CAM_ASM_000658 /LENGTH=36 /DNA_ID= /DNA_START= /DNA_END= /DNA_ORIENTATION=